MQSARAPWGIRIGTGVLPFAFMIPSVVPLLFLPINRARERELSEFSQNRQADLQKDG